MFYQIELEWIQAIQTIHTVFLNHFFYLWNYVETTYFYYFLVLFVWIWFGWKWGARLFYLIFSANLLCYYLKDIIQSPRPFQMLENIAHPEVISFGLPSGAGVNAALLSGLLIFLWKQHKTLAWIIGGLFFSLLSFSRIYLGVHFFHDIIGGWILGFLVLWAFISFGPRIEKQLKKRPLWVFFLIGELFPLSIYLQYPSDILLREITFSLMGMTAGLVLSAKYHLLPSNIPISDRKLEGCITFLGSILLTMVGIFWVHRSLIPFVVIVWFSVGSLYLFRLKNHYFHY
ncbi:MAG: phosphatase PAP2 family protein [Chlamydiota bacterium]